MVTGTPPASHTDVSTCSPDVKATPGRQAARCLVGGPHSRPMMLATFAGAAFMLASCGGSGPVLPSRSSSLSRETSRSVAPPSLTSTAATPTEISTTSAPNGAPRPTVTRTPITPTPTAATATVTLTAAPPPTATLVPTLTVAPTVTSAPPTPQTATPTPTQSQAVTATSSTTSSTPAWLWWLIGAVVLVVAVLIALLMRKRNRKRAWADKLSSSDTDVAWFARELIPQLSQAPSVQQMAGGWRISSDRVVAAEDRLTTLEAAAVDDMGRGQTRTLRGAVRGARARLDTLATVYDRAEALSLLQAAAGELEAALAAVRPATQPSAPDDPLPG
jgi:hypothetical protein